MNKMAALGYQIIVFLLDMLQSKSYEMISIGV